MLFLFSIWEKCGLGLPTPLKSISSLISSVSQKLLSFISKYSVIMLPSLSSFVFFFYRNNLGLIILSYILFLAFGGIYLLETSPKHMTVVCVVRWHVEYLVILARGWVCVLILKTLGSTDLATVFVFRYLWFSTHAQWLYARLRYYFFRSNRFMHWIFHLPDFKFYVPWSMMCNFIAVSINLRINRFRQIHCN